MSDSEPGVISPGAERRSRLRQYQVQLLERVQAARSGAPAEGRELGVLLGERRCLLDLTQVGEIVPLAPLSPLTPVPMARDWYLGLANIRGNLTGVIDLARYMGQAPSGLGLDLRGQARLITFAPGLGFNCALLAGRVLGLRKLAGMTAAATEAADDDAGQPWRSQHFIDAEAQRWTRLDLAQLVREPRFLQVGI